MRILILFNRYVYRGGEDTYVEYLISLLKKRGHKVLLYEKDSRDIKNIFDSLRAGIGLFWNRETNLNIDRIIKSFDPDIAHFHNIYPLISPTAYRVCKRHSIPIIQTIHNYKFMCPKNSLYRDGSLCDLCVGKTIAWPSIIYGCYHESRLSSLVYSFAFAFHRLMGSFAMIDTYIFPTKFVKDYYCKHLSFINPKKAIVLPYAAPSFGNHVSSSDKDYYLFVGRLAEEKGITQLIDQFIESKRKLVVLGSGPLESQLKNKCRTFANIRLIPHTNASQVRKYMTRAKAVIIPSRWYEVLPFVFLEATALGKMIFMAQNANLRTIDHRNNVVFYNPKFFSHLNKKLTIYERLTQSPKKSKMPNVYMSAYHYKTLISLYEALA